MRFIGCLVSALIVATSAFADVTGNARVVDGDTIHVGNTKIRLYGIDAPERKQTCTAGGKEWSCGQEASKALLVAIDDDRLWSDCYQGGCDHGSSRLRSAHC